MIPSSHPVLTCEGAGAFEKALFKGDEEAEWAAMTGAGRAVASAVRRDFGEIGGLPPSARMLVLAGRGHNAGDALIAARTIIDGVPGASADVLFVLGERPLRPLAQRAWRELAAAAPGRVRTVRAPAAGGYDLSLDGVFGHSFRPPLPGKALAALRLANELPVRLRAAVDLPSGLGESGAFRADFSYATGVVKSPLLACANAGRLRYLDLGFFAAGRPAAGGDRVLVPGLLAPLAALRPPRTDKRDHGHLLVLGGSLDYPGSVLMTVLAALKSGAGLVTAFVPESLVPSYAARAPEAMWVGCPEPARRARASGDCQGGMGAGVLPLLGRRWGRATALVAGPGMGGDPGTRRLLAGIAKSSPVPLVLDADALRPEIVRALKVPAILTPHAGEFARIAPGGDLRSFCGKTGATVVLKGPVTRISAPGEAVYHSFFGGPVLARGGSGDVLAGLIGGLLAQGPKDPLLAACRGTVWHGLAADHLARAMGQTAARAAELVEFLPAALRDNP